MTERTYPYNGWRLTPAFRLVEVRIKRRDPWLRAYDQAEGGTSYRRKDIHLSREEAIAAGRKKIEARREYLKKQAERLDRLSAALDKAGSN